jgi:hypothetical protein
LVRTLVRGLLAMSLISSISFELRDTNVSSENAFPPVRTVSCAG